MATATKDNMFGSKSPAGSKKSDGSARAIIDDEVALRDAKTARLRLARLAKEAADREAAASAPAAPPRPKIKRPR